MGKQEPVKHTQWKVVITYVMASVSFMLQPDHFGIIPRSITEVFKSIQSCKEKGVKFLVRASYLQIYNEVIRYDPCAVPP